MVSIPGLRAPDVLRVALVRTESYMVSLPKSVSSSSPNPAAFASESEPSSVEVRSEVVAELLKFRDGTSLVGRPVNCMGFEVDANTAGSPSGLGWKRPELRRDVGLAFEYGSAGVGIFRGLSVCMLGRVEDEEVRWKMVGSVISRRFAGFSNSWSGAVFESPPSVRGAENILLPVFFVNLENEDFLERCFQFKGVLASLSLMENRRGLLSASSSMHGKASVVRSCGVEDGIGDE